MSCEVWIPFGSRTRSLFSLTAGDDGRCLGSQADFRFILLLFRLLWWHRVRPIEPTSSASSYKIRWSSFLFALFLHDVPLSTSHRIRHQHPPLSLYIQSVVLFVISLLLTGLRNYYVQTTRRKQFKDSSNNLVSDFASSSSSLWQDKEPPGTQKTHRTIMMASSCKSLKCLFLSFLISSYTHWINRSCAPSKQFRFSLKRVVSRHRLPRMVLWQFSCE